MTAWTEATDAARERFIDDLEQRGFTFHALDEFTGRLQVADSSERVTVRLGPAFPFAPPDAFPEANYPRSWHSELSGAMCLYPQEGRESLPWLAADSFIALVARWFEQSRLGWPDDTPDLDLDRYFHAAEDRTLVLYSSIDELIGKYIFLRRTRHAPTMTVSGTGSIPAKIKPRKDRAFGYVADIGEPTEPPNDWDSLTALLAPEIVAKLTKAVRDRRISCILVVYRRREHQAVLALETHDTVAGIELRSLSSASTDSETLLLRSGIQSDQLQDKSVLLLGAGSIGSFLADALQRAGLGKLTIRDGDVLRPGNLIRHLAGEEFLGQPKASALQTLLTARMFNATSVETDDTYLTDPAEIPDLMEAYDLVIDATASAAVTPMINVAARSLGHTVLNVCVKDTGRIIRVDVIPPLDGADELTERPIEHTDEPQIFEAGCGDPVSLTPPHSVCEAAQIAARHAIGLLLAEPVSPSGELRDFRAAP